MHDIWSPSFFFSFFPPQDAMGPFLSRRSTRGMLSLNALPPCIVECLVAILPLTSASMRGGEVKKSDKKEKVAGGGPSALDALMRE